VITGQKRWEDGQAVKSCYRERGGNQENAQPEQYLKAHNASVRTKSDGNSNSGCAGCAEVSEENAAHPEGFGLGARGELLSWGVATAHLWGGGGGKGLSGKNTHAEVQNIVVRAESI